MNPTFAVYVTLNPSTVNSWCKARNKTEKFSFHGGVVFKEFTSANEMTIKTTNMYAVNGLNRVM